MEPTAVSVEVARGDAVLARLDDAAYLEDWERLRATCPWATSFQSVAFVDCWYRLHEHLYEPVVVEGRDQDGVLVGLLTLARRRTGRRLVGAGDIHAEYQAWIAQPAAVEPFMLEALQLLERLFPRGRVHFNYLAPGTPLDWVSRESRWPGRIQVTSRHRGLIDLSDPSGIDASLRKGHNRSRLNHLRRVGDVALETIDTVDGLEAEIDEIAVLCDLRQGAVNNSLPFANNPLKRPLHLALMERGLLHVTILRVGTAIASAHLDMRNGDEVLIYLIAHTPVFARESPGSLHNLLLARELSGLGIVRYDLSPGGGYKDRYATDRQVVHRMTVQFGFAERIAAHLGARAVSAATAALAATGRTPREARLEVRRLRARAGTRLRPRAAGDMRDGACAVLRLPDRGDAPASAQLAVGRLGDLLAYDPRRFDGPPLTRFLQLALHRLELGHRVLTRLDGGALAECWWLGPIAARSAAPPDRSDGSTTASMLLYDPLVPAQVPGSPAAREMLHRLASTLQAVAPGATTYLAVPAGKATLVDGMVHAGASRVGDVGIPGTPARGGTRVAQGPDPATALAGPLAEVAATLARCWPVDRPDGA